MKIFVCNAEYLNRNENVSFGEIYLNMFKDTLEKFTNDIEMFSDNFENEVNKIKEKMYNLNDDLVILFKDPLPFLKSDTLEKALKRQMNTSENLSALHFGEVVFHIFKASDFIENAEITYKNSLNFNDKTSQITEEFLVINSVETVALAEKTLRRNINFSHIKNGVTIVDVDSTYIGEKVLIGEKTIIHPNTYIVGDTKIGEGASIGPDTKIVNSEIQGKCDVSFSVVTDSLVGEGSSVGPFAYLRPHSIIGKNCKIGDFVEIKNSTLGDKTKVSHLTYVGDSDVGNGVNFGCGTVTVNYDGANKFRATIGDGAFIGCNTNIVSPVTIGAGAYTAAGSTITEDVPEDALSIARARQINKTNWIKKTKK